MKFTFKKILLVIVACLALVSFVSCDEKREDIRVGLLTTDESLSNYFTGVSRNQINATIYDQLVAEQTALYRSQGKSFNEDTEKKWKKENVALFNDWSIDKESSELDSSILDTFSNSYNKVKTTYILFESDITEIEKAFDRAKSPLDVAFISAAALEAAGHKLNMTRANCNLKVVFIETYKNGAINGFWVMSDKFLEKCPANAKKFIASLVQSNEYCNTYMGSETSFTGAISDAETVVENKKNDPEYNSIKWIYKTVNVLSCSEKDSFCAELSDFNKKLDPYYYLTVLNDGFKDYESLSMTEVNYSYNRISAALACVSYGDGLGGLAGAALLTNLASNSLENSDGCFKLDIMLEQSRLYAEATLTAHKPN